MLNWDKDDDGIDHTLCGRFFIRRGKTLALLGDDEAQGSPTRHGPDGFQLCEFRDNDLFIVADGPTVAYLKGIAAFIANPPKFQD